MLEEQVESIAQITLRPSERLSTVKAHMLEGVMLLEEWGVTSPNKRDYQRLEEHFRANGRGRSASNIRRATQRYYDYLKKGETQMMLGIEEKEIADQQEDTSVEVPTEEKESVFFSVDTPNTEYSTADTEAEQKPKRGRKPKNAAERKTVKLSIYLTESLFADLRDLAHYTQQDISDVLFGLVEDFSLRNREALLDYRSFLARRKAIK